jgi:hypothetical protein
MSIITKTFAAEVAKKLTEKKAKSLATAEANLKALLTEMYVRSLSPEVVKLFDKMPAYFKTRNDLQLSGNGFSYEWVGLSNSMPCISQYFTPDEDQAKILNTAIDERDAKKRELSGLKDELILTLLSLRSYKKIGEFLPEAIPFLPEKITTALAVNLSDLRDRLK